jgi:hypothetical protein
VQWPFVEESLVMASSTSSTHSFRLLLWWPQHEGAFSLYELLAGAAPIHVQLRGIRGRLTAVSLATSSAPLTLSLAAPNATLLPSDWTHVQFWNASGGDGAAELWLHNGGTLTFRIQLTVNPPREQCPPGSILNFGMGEQPSTCQPVRLRQTHAFAMLLHCLA